MKKSRNIVFIGFLLGFGGAEKSMIMTANGLSNLGYRVTIVSLKNNNAVYEINENVQYIFILDVKGNKIIRQIRRFLNLKNVLSKIKPDITISFWLQPAIFTAVISKICRFRTIYSERGDPTDKEYNGLLGILRSLFFNLIDGFVFQTQGAKQCFSKSIQDKSVVINNPVYIKYNDYDVPIERRKVIVNVGRLHEQKNQKLLINAFAKISSIFPDYTLEIYGDGELKSNLESQIKMLNLDNRVFLKGTTNNLYDEIIDASLFVLSSDYEGMPNALMEAMALGLPCISTDYNPGGAGELIKNNVNGLVCRRQSEDELANCMRYMLENPKEARRMGLKAKEICYSHSKNVIFKMWDDYIMKLLKVKT